MPLIIGLGTGRCGTLSLATLLDRQPAAHVTHERWHRHTAWTGSLAVVDQAIGQMLSENTTLTGDVAHYYLPYVPHIARRVPQARFVCLERNREEVIESFLHKIGRGHRWLEHDGSHWQTDPVWDKCFPKYPITDRRRAIARYWDEYAEHARHLAETLPDRFRIFPTETLNTESGQQTLLAFAGLPAKQIRTVLPLRENRSQGRREKRKAESGKRE